MASVRTRRRQEPWRNQAQKVRRSFQGRQNTILKYIKEINRLPNTRFGVYGQHNGQWLIYEPDEQFSRDTGIKIKDSHALFQDEPEPQSPQLSFQVLPLQQPSPPTLSFSSSSELSFPKHSPELSFQGTPPATNLINTHPLLQKFF